MKNIDFLRHCKSIHYDRAVNLIKLTALILILPLFSALPTQAQSGSATFRTLTTGYGPEDMVRDTLHSPSRLLVACASRRPEYPVYGEIEAIDPANGSRTILRRTGEPAGLRLNPHGISLIAAGEIQYLYVISHDDAHHSHPVIRYQVDGDTLAFVEVLNSKLLISPNALQAYPDGSLLVCNDAGIRNNRKEQIFKQKRGNILYYDGLGNWTIAAMELGMPAGLTGLGNRIFVSATLENKLYSYLVDNGQLKDKTLVCSIKGPDNIRIDRNRLIVTSHSKILKFIGHARNKSHPSPSMVLSIDPETGQKTRLFYDNGKRISAASVAVISNGQLFIGQIFEPFIGVHILF
jgi:arylesterase/paraoxonase